MIRILKTKVTQHIDAVLAQVNGAYGNGIWHELTRGTPNTSPRDSPRKKKSAASAPLTARSVPAVEGRSRRARGRYASHAGAYSVWGTPPGAVVWSVDIPTLMFIEFRRCIN